MERITLTLNRNDMSRVRTALTAQVISFMDELRDPEITEDRKEIAQRSLEMWKKIREEVISQLEA